MRGVLRMCAVAAMAGACGDLPPDTFVDAGIDAPPVGPPNPCKMKPLVFGSVTLAGCSITGTEDGPREMARFANPTNVVFLPNGGVEPRVLGRTLPDFAGSDRDVPWHIDLDAPVSRGCVRALGYVPRRREFVALGTVFMPMGGDRLVPGDVR